MKDISRRALIKGLFATSVVVGFDLAGRSWVTRAGAAGDFAELPQLDGTLTTDPATLAAAADDVSHIIHRTPVAVLRHEGKSGSRSSGCVFTRYTSDNTRILRLSRNFDDGLDGEGRGRAGQAARPRSGRIVPVLLGP